MQVELASRFRFSLLYDEDALQRVSITNEMHVVAIMVV